MADTAASPKATSEVLGDNTIIEKWNIVGKIYKDVCVCVHACVRACVCPICQDKITDESQGKTRQEDSPLCWQLFHVATHGECSREGGTCSTCLHWRSQGMAGKDSIHYVGSCSRCGYIGSTVAFPRTFNHSEGPFYFPKWQLNQHQNQISVYEGHDIEKWKPLLGFTRGSIHWLPRHSYYI